MMSIRVIGDRNTVLGLGLVGAEGDIVENAQAAREALERALGDESAELVLVTRPWADTMRDRVDRLKMTSFRPLVIEIPGRNLDASRRRLADVVRRAVGMGG